jgi:Bacterial Ig-like domain (group 3)
MVTLTATVASGTTTKVTAGTVNFCDATAAYCTDIHLLGTAQLTSAGTATINLLPGIGSHSFNAVFVGTSSYTTSSSSTDQLTVTITGTYPTATTATGITAYSTANGYTVAGGGRAFASADREDTSSHQKRLFVNRHHRLQAVQRNTLRR